MNVGRVRCKVEWRIEKGREMSERQQKRCMKDFISFYQMLA